MANVGYLLQDSSVTTMPVGILSKTTGIDGTAAATTNLYTVPTGKTAVVTGITTRVTSANTLTVVGTASFGRNAGVNDIMAATAFTGLLATTQAFPIYPSAVMTLGAAGDVISIKITVGFTAVSCTIAVDLIGYLF